MDELNYHHLWIEWDQERDMVYGPLQWLVVRSKGIYSIKKGDKGLVYDGLRLDLGSIHRRSLLKGMYY